MSGPEDFIRDPDEDLCRCEDCSAGPVLAPAEQLVMAGGVPTEAANDA